MQIILTVPDAKLTELKLGFLAMCPVPMIRDPASIPENPLPPIPEFTELQWLKEWIKRDIFRAYQHGKLKLAQDAAQIDKGIII